MIATGIQQSNYRSITIDAKNAFSFGGSMEQEGEEQKLHAVDRISLSDCEFLSCNGSNGSTGC